MMRNKERCGDSKVEDLRLTSDLAFKAVFGRNRKECKRALAGLLNAILGEEDPIVDLSYINPFNPQNYEEDKLSCMDIKLVTKGGKRISVEMQMAVGPVFISRSIYYEAQLVTEELNESDNYQSMHRSIFIGILAENLFEDQSIHRKYRLKDVTNGNELSDLVELHYVELKKADARKSPVEMSAVEKWALYLSSAGRAECGQLVEELTKESEVIEMAETIRREVSKDEELRARAFSKKLFRMDVEARFIELRERYTAEMKEVKEKKLEEGIYRGIEQGIEQGKLEDQRMIAQKMLQEGLGMELTCKLTGLVQEEVEGLKGQG